jgi:bisphosphoglycerate-independent phosphoglycerate mutase (AlkP superfamily)
MKSKEEIEEGDIVIHINYGECEVGEISKLLGAVALYPLNTQTTNKNPNKAVMAWLKDITFKQD